VIIIHSTENRVESQNILINTKINPRKVSEMRLVKEVHVLFFIIKKSSRKNKIAITGCPEKEYLL